MPKVVSASKKELLYNSLKALTRTTEVRENASMMALTLDREILNLETL
jgi:hypothetical protein